MTNLPTVTVLADSVNPRGERLTTLLLTGVERFLLAELNTHRALSRNTASSRAISVAERIRRLKAEPVEPIWYRETRGMAAREPYPEGPELRWAQMWYDDARTQAFLAAEEMDRAGVHKSIVNRILEPYVRVDIIVSATEWANFLALRMAPDAEPALQRLAWRMRAALRDSTPVLVAWGGWHVPYGEAHYGPPDAAVFAPAVARLARVSTERHEEERSPERERAFYDRLLAGGHLSPFEHVAQASRYGTGNYTGWRQLRHVVGRDRTWGDVEALERYTV